MRYVKTSLAGLLGEKCPHNIQVQNLNSRFKFKIQALNLNWKFEFTIQDPHFH